MVTATKGRACGDKKAFTSKKAGMEFIFYLARRRGANPKSYNVYYCKHCGKLHVGHKPKQRHN